MNKRILINGLYPEERKIAPGEDGRLADFYAGADSKENLLRTIIETVPECVKLIAPDGTLLMMNRAGLAMIEADSFEQVKGKPVYPLVFPEYREAFKEHMKDVFEGKTAKLLFAMRGIKGRRLLLETHSVPLRNRADEIVAMLGITRDITEQKKAEGALRESEERYRDLFEDTSDLIQIVRPDGRFLYVNPSWRETFGYSEEEIASLFIFDIIDASCGAHCADTFQRVMSEGRVSKIETIFIAKDGRKIMVEGSATCKFADGKPISTRCMFRDVTEKKKLEEELLKAQKLESIGILAGGIAHDFNNLLTAILGNISLSRTYTTSGFAEKVYERLIEAEKASLRAKDLTTQLLTFSKGGEPIKKAAPIGELIKDSVDFALRGSKVKSEYFVPHNLWAVEADEGQVNQVMSNLIINAKEAMPEGGIVKISCENVTVRSADVLPLKHGKYVKISIKDRGIGIPRAFLQKIFDPYFTTKEKGSGLGLAVVFSIIKRHGGHIFVESEVGTGTVFHIYLPASEKEVPRETEREETILLGKGKILVMDDEMIVRDVAGEMLKSLGYEVKLVGSGEETIETYQRAKESHQAFDVVIMDLTIPGGLGGREAIKRLLEIDSDIKCIVSSGYSEDPVMSNFKKYGFKEVIAKPYKLQELSETVYKVMAMLPRSS